MAVIENEEAFWRYEDVLPEVDIGIYAAGKLPDVAISWLLQQDIARCQFVHWGDYDAVGLSQYARLRNTLGERVTLHRPPQLEHLLVRYGNRDLYERQVLDLNRLRDDGDAALQAMIRLFDKYHRCLEQEVLLRIDGIEI